MKVVKYLILLLPVLLFISCSQIQNKPAQPAPTMVEFPKWAYIVLEDQTFKEEYEFNFFINPFYLQADFDKDGFNDMVILIKGRNSGYTGIALLRNGEKQATIFGAGKQNSFGGENWEWLRTWKTETVLPAGAGVQPVGATLILFPKNVQQNAPWLFWNGKAWQWKTD